jgi:hypothetical protein
MAERDGRRRPTGAARVLAEACACLIGLLVASGCTVAALPTTAGGAGDASGVSSAAVGASELASVMIHD